ncbi:hypothetical protein TCAL_13183 [Tigriopus californicus]|uniref:CUB domain-containing protein n=1 Tax=Tigriopus californicus TaxID=6832 RepID=A0A553PP27_TIGCA|nr:uncharacterized protein LOC131882326 [Tigriopus californicus]TRY79437.1 hypothetical protein TCAL_13183 [Tigriopus californicus]|eukprot:TCALIF_13183-PA protein Name:"Similar to GPR126 G-protein coupled receptor 126 (Homo sapiens)" AED:0.34 eAED:0.34 QI:0/0.5/0/0.66/1/1/3/0/582
MTLTFREIPSWSGGGTRPGSICSLVPWLMVASTVPCLSSMRVDSSSTFNREASTHNHAGYSSSSSVSFMPHSQEDPTRNGGYSLFNKTSFISRDLDGLAAEARHRQFTTKELAAMFRSAGCINDEIILYCAHVNETIVIESASFYALPQMALNCSNGPIGPIPSMTTPVVDPLRETFFPQLLGLPRISRDLRQALNRRCSGLSKGIECSFNLRLDHPESTAWGSGLIDIFYRCAPNDWTHRYCDRTKRIATNPSGASEYITSPMYPKYYVGGRSCKWSIRAEPGQRIQLRFLDISLRERVSSTDPECTDSISVSERGKTLLRMCGESNEDIMLLSDGYTLDVNMDTRTNTIYPKRGFLAEFWPLGCPNPVGPMDGYLQYRNDTIAVYSCSLGHIFLPSLERYKQVRCWNREWDQEVGNCVSIDFLGKHGNASLVSRLMAKTGYVPVSSSSHPQQRIIVPSVTSSWFSDVVLPVIFVGVVIILSLFAVIVLLLIKRHFQYEHEGGHQDEDRSALTPGSIRRHSPLLNLEFGPSHFMSHDGLSDLGPGIGMGSTRENIEAGGGGGVGHSHLNPLHPQREELFLC